MSAELAEHAARQADLMRPLAIVDKRARARRANPSDERHWRSRATPASWSMTSRFGGPVVNRGRCADRERATDVYAYITHGVLSVRRSRMASSNLKELVSPTRSSRPGACAARISGVVSSTLIGEAIRAHGCRGIGIKPVDDDRRRARSSFETRLTQNPKTFQNNLQAFQH